MATVHSDRKRKLQDAEDISFGEPNSKSKKEAHNRDNIISGLIRPLQKVEPCQLLQQCHVPCYTKGIPKEEVKGVYKIAYDRETIYISSDHCHIATNLLGHFSGQGPADLAEFLSSLDDEGFSKITLFWLYDTKYEHNCGGKCYLECILQLLGRKPRFNQGVDGTSSVKSNKAQKEQQQYSSLDKLKRTPSPKELVTKLESERGKSLERASGLMMPINAHIKPCRLLLESHLPYSSLSYVKKKGKGVFKIAYKWETIYVSSDTCDVGNQLQKQFSSQGQADLFAFLSRLKESDFDQISVFWLYDKRQEHYCTGKSYLDCVFSLQGHLPRFNQQVVSSNVSGFYQISDHRAKPQILRQSFKDFRQGHELEGVIQQLKKAQRSKPVDSTTQSLSSQIGRTASLQCTKPVDGTKVLNNSACSYSEATPWKPQVPGIAPRSSEFLELKQSERSDADKMLKGRTNPRTGSGLKLKQSPTKKQSTIVVDKKRLVNVEKTESAHVYQPDARYPPVHAADSLIRSKEMMTMHRTHAATRKNSIIPTNQATPVQWKIVNNPIYTALPVPQDEACITKNDLPSVSMKDGLQKQQHQQVEKRQANKHLKFHNMSYKLKSDIKIPKILKLLSTPDDKKEGEERAQAANVDNPLPCSSYTKCSSENGINFSKSNVSAMTIEKNMLKSVLAKSTAAASPFVHPKNRSSAQLSPHNDQQKSSSQATLIDKTEMSVTYGYTPAASAVLESYPWQQHQLCQPPRDQGKIGLKRLVTEHPKDDFEGEKKQLRLEPQYLERVGDQDQMQCHNINSPHRPGAPIMKSPIDSVPNTSDSSQPFVLDFRSCIKRGQTSTTLKHTPKPTKQMLQDVTRRGLLNTGTNKSFHVRGQSDADNQSERSAQLKDTSYHEICLHDPPQSWPGFPTVWPDIKMNKPENQLVQKTTTKAGPQQLPYIEESPKKLSHKSLTETVAAPLPKSQLSLSQTSTTTEKQSNDDQKNGHQFQGGSSIILAGCTQNLHHNKESIEKLSHGSLTDIVQNPKPNSSVLQPHRDPKLFNHQRYVSDFEETEHILMPHKKQQTPKVQDTYFEQQIPLSHQQIQPSSLTLINLSSKRKHIGEPVKMSQSHVGIAQEVKSSKLVIQLTETENQSRVQVHFNDNEKGNNLRSSKLHKASLEKITNDRNNTEEQTTLPSGTKHICDMEKCTDIALEKVEVQKSNSWMIRGQHDEFKDQSNNAGKDEVEIEKQIKLRIDEVDQLQCLKNNKDSSHHHQPQIKKDDSKTMVDRPYPHVSHKTKSSRLTASTNDTHSRDPVNKLTLKPSHSGEQLKDDSNEGSCFHGPRQNWPGFMAASSAVTNSKSKTLSVHNVPTQAGPADNRAGIQQLLCNQKLHQTTLTERCPPQKPGQMSSLETVTTTEKTYDDKRNVHQSQSGSSMNLAASSHYWHHATESPNMLTRRSLAKMVQSRQQMQRRSPRLIDISKKKTNIGEPFRKPPSLVASILSRPHRQPTNAKAGSKTKVDFPDSTVSCKKKSTNDIKSRSPINKLTLKSTQSGEQAISQKSTTSRNVADSLPRKINDREKRQSVIKAKHTSGSSESKHKVDRNIRVNRGDDHNDVRDDDRVSSTSHVAKKVYNATSNEALVTRGEEPFHQRNIFISKTDTRSDNAHVDGESDYEDGDDSLDDVDDESDDNSDEVDSRSDDNTSDEDGNATHSKDGFFNTLISNVGNMFVSVWNNTFRHNT